MFSQIFNRQKSPPAEKGLSIKDYVAWHGPTSPRWSMRDGDHLAKAGHGRNVVAYACVQSIVEAGSTVPLMVEGAGHHVTRLESRLACPNPEQDGPSFLSTLLGHLQIYGNTYIERVGTPEAPLAYYLWRPDGVTIETDSDGWPKNYVYQVGHRQRRVSADRSRLSTSGEAQAILHLKLYHATDDLYGQAPMHVAGDAIDIYNSALAWNKSLLDNAARPSGALIYRGVEGATNLTDDQYSRLKAELEINFQGAMNTGRPLVLDGGLDWRPMSMSPSDMDILDLKHSAARDIALAFGVPPMLLGIPGDNTYSNYKEAQRAFWRQTVLPLLSKVASTLTQDLEGSGLRIVPDLHRHPVLGIDQQERLKLLLSTDVLTVDEKRALLGYPPQELGTDHAD